jgi:hypothetical protein
MWSELNKILSLFFYFSHGIKGEGLNNDYDSASDLL